MGAEGADVVVVSGGGEGDVGGAGGDWVSDFVVVRASVEGCFGYLYYVVCIGCEVEACIHIPSQITKEREISYRNQPIVQLYIDSQHRI